MMNTKPTSLTPTQTAAQDLGTCGSTATTVDNQSPRQATPVCIFEDVDATHVMPSGRDPDDYAFGRVKPLFSAPWPKDDSTNSAYLACEKWINDNPNVHFASCASLPNSKTSRALGKYTEQKSVACYCDCKNKEEQ